jgi:microcystin-dependent protein
MTAVDIFKASRMLEIENTTVVSGLVDPSGHLLLSTRAGEEIDAGDVIGPIGPGYTYRGAWTPNTVYAVNDVVTNDGSTYLVTTAHTSSTTPPTAEAPGPNLSMWAQRGYEGTDGTDGTDGQDGAPGDPAVPAGTITLWASDTAPANWLICDGSAVSRATYPSLFDAIGIKYGAGDGVNTFNLPNLKGRTPIGKDSAQTEFAALAQTGGEKTHKLTSLEGAIRDHTHVLPMGSIAGVGGTLDIPARASGTSGTVDGSFRTGRPADNSLGTNGAGVYGNAALSGTANMDAVNAHNVLQPYTVVNFIIKVTAGETPSDSELTQRISALEAQFSATPAGTITGWGGTTAPPNWLLCDGSAVSRATYASLFAAIGIAFGAGDGSTTFNLPNLKGRVPVGRDATQTEFDVLGETGGEKSHLLTIAEMPAHSHTTRIRTAITWAGLSAGAQIYGLDSAGNDATSTTGGGTAHNNLQPYQVVNYIIKFTNGDVKTDSQLTQRVSTLESSLTVAQQTRLKVGRAKDLLHGGGQRIVGDGNFSWSSQFRTMGMGVDTLAPSGYFNIAMPPDGTVIPVHGHNTVTSITVGSLVAGRISFNAISGYPALYYDLPIGAIATSQPNRFHIVDYLAGPFTIPDTWVLIINRTIDAMSPEWHWGDGRLQDWWHGFGLLNGWSNFDPAWSDSGWKRTSEGEIIVRGLVKGGTGVIMSADAGRPGPSKTMIFNQQASGGYARIDAATNGTLSVITYLGSTNGWVSLEAIRWYPAGS